MTATTTIICILIASCTITAHARLWKVGNDASRNDVDKSRVRQPERSPWLSLLEFIRNGNQYPREKLPWRHKREIQMEDEPAELDPADQEDEEMDDDGVSVSIMELEDNAIDSPPTSSKGRVFGYFGDLIKKAKKAAHKILTGKECNPGSKMPDKAHCHKYWLCHPSGHKYTLRVCAARTYFDWDEESCVAEPKKTCKYEYPKCFCKYKKNHGPDPYRPDIVEGAACTEKDDFPNPINCKKYWVCRKKKFWVAYICPLLRPHFDMVDGDCRLFPKKTCRSFSDCFCPILLESKMNSTESDMAGPSCGECEEKKPCDKNENRKFGSKTHCHKYFKCQPLPEHKDGTWQGKTCPGDQVYDWYGRICTSKPNSTCGDFGHCDCQGHMPTTPAPVTLPPTPYPIPTVETTPYPVPTVETTPYPVPPVETTPYPVPPVETTPFPLPPGPTVIPPPSPPDPYRPDIDEGTACTETDEFPNPFNCSQYWKCRRPKVWAIVSCPIGEVFDLVIKKCTDKPEMTCKSLDNKCFCKGYETLATKAKSFAKAKNCDKCKNNFPCDKKESESFVNLKSCHSFWKCRPDDFEDGIWERRTCPEGEFFDWYGRICTSEPDSTCSDYGHCKCPGLDPSSTTAAPSPIVDPCKPVDPIDGCSSESVEDQEISFKHSISARSVSSRPELRYVEGTSLLTGVDYRISPWANATVNFKLTPNPNPTETHLAITYAEAPKGKGECDLNAIFKFVYVGTQLLLVNKEEDSVLMPDNLGDSLLMESGDLIPHKVEWTSDGFKCLNETEDSNNYCSRQKELFIWVEEGAEDGKITFGFRNKDNSNRRIVFYPYKFRVGYPDPRVGYTKIGYRYSEKQAEFTFHVDCNCMK